MQTLARERDGQCLSTEYVNNDTKLRWKCQEGHEWEATPKNVVHGGSWCPTCAGIHPLGLAQMQALARERDGQCLSTEYVNSDTKLRWKCQEGHEWEATPCSVVHSVYVVKSIRTNAPVS